MKEKLHNLYYGDTEIAHKFRIALIFFDLVTITFFIISSMVPDTPDYILIIDYCIAVVLIVDYFARMIVANRPWRFVFRIGPIMDLIVIVSLLAPLMAGNLAFLRVVRMLRLLRSYHLLRELREESKWFRKNEEILQSSVNLFVFVFVITAIVYVAESHQNPNINNYLDALYFTVTTLTTTGFGDITMQDTTGRLIAVIIMVFGVALFLRLVQTIFRPEKVNYACPECGLERHEPDAVHCKHCGDVLKIPTEGHWS